MPPGGATSHLDAAERAGMGDILQCLDVSRSQVAGRVFGSPTRCRLDVHVRVRFRVVAVVVRVDSTGATNGLAPLLRVGGVSAAVTLAVFLRVGGATVAIVCAR